MGGPTILGPIEEASALRYAPEMYDRPRDMEHFFTREKQRVCKLAQKFGIPENEIEDFWMEVVLAFHANKKLDFFDPSRGKWTTFIFRVVRNHASNYRRKFSKEPVYKAVSFSDFSTSEDRDAATQGYSEEYLMAKNRDLFPDAYQGSEEDILQEQFKEFVRGKKDSYIPYPGNLGNFGMEVKEGYFLVDMFQALMRGDTQVSLAKTWGSSHSVVMKQRETLKELLGEFLEKVA